MQKLSLFLFIILLSVASVLAQDNSVLNRAEKDIVIIGDEPSPNVPSSNINLSGSRIETQTVYGPTLNWTTTQIGTIATGYDLQSNASTQQLWYHKATNRLHAIFCTSQQSASWTDRTVSYFTSTNSGSTWTHHGQVPPAPPAGARSGFPAIYGLADGSAVATSHHNLGGGSTRTQIHIDAGPGAFNFVNFDPGNTPVPSQAIWPRLVVGSNDNVALASSVSGGAADAWTNFFNISTTQFAGWTPYKGGTAETYSLAVSNGGKVGHLYLGANITSPATDSSGMVFFRESTNGGQTWGTITKVFQPFRETGDTNWMAPIRGLNLTWRGEQPAAVFEVVRRSFSAGSYFPGWPSSIYFWSPGINNGIPLKIVDSVTVPYYPNQGVADVMTPICRPVIARAEGNSNFLFVAFSAAGPDTSFAGTRKFEGWFTYTTNGGLTWSTPERFTPRLTPRLDYRYISIAPIAPFSNNEFRIHLVAQGDTTAGSQVNGAPAGVTARFFHFTTTITAVGIEDGNNTPNTFELAQNYPNPFNPSTNIKYSVAERSNVAIKVYDMLGKEVATLVNEVKDAGSYDINFDASNLASGMYIYTITAGNFTASKKMMLMK